MRSTPRKAQPLAVLLFIASGAACEKDPFDPATYYGKLDNPRTFDQAVRDLDRLRDLRAVKPLGKAWKKWNKPSSALRAIIAISGTNDPDKKRVPNYDDALPFLIEAVDDFDPGYERSMDDATAACDALGKSAKPEAADVLIKAANRVVTRNSPANRVRMAAVKALGNFEKNQRVVDTLVRIVEASPKEQMWKLNAAAALALAQTETNDPKALAALARAAFADNRFYPQARAGIARMGKPAIAKAFAIFEEKDEQTNAFAKENRFSEVAPGALTYKGALLLGDMRASEHAAALAAGLKAEARPIGIDEKTGQETPASTHTGILDSLRRIGNQEVASAVYEYMISNKADPFARPIAVDVYSTLTRDTKALDWLMANIKDGNADPQLRLASILAYGRLARTEAQAETLRTLSSQYEDEAKKQEEVLKSSANQDDKWKAEEKKVIAEQLAGSLKESAVRIDALVGCEEKAQDKSPAQVAVCLAKNVEAKDVAMGKPGLPRAERSLLELMKMGKEARPAADILLKNVESGERMVREGILLALPRIAELPCEKCVSRMNEVMEKQSSQTTLDALNLETRVVMHYFTWAGK